MFVNRKTELNSLNQAKISCLVKSNGPRNRSVRISFLLCWKKLNTWIGRIRKPITPCSAVQDLRMTCKN